MRTTRQTEQRPSVLMTVLAIALIAAFIILPAYQLGWLPDWMFGPGVIRVDAPPTVAPLPPTAPAAQPQAPVAPVVPTAYIPAEHVTEFQPLPPADVPVEEVQERTEIVTVQRAPEQTTIVRTVPNNPAGAPIVIDKGVKCKGVCR